MNIDKKRLKLWVKYWTLNRHVKFLTSQKDYVGAARLSLQAIKLKKRLKG